MLYISPTCLSVDHGLIHVTNNIPYVFVLLTEDVTPPSLQWVGKLPTQTTGSVALSWTTDEAVTSVCSVDSPVKTVNVSCSNRWVGTDLRNGEHCLTVKMVDGSGNKAEAKYCWNNSKDCSHKYYFIFREYPYLFGSFLSREKVQHRAFSINVASRQHRQQSRVR